MYDAVPYDLSIDTPAPEGMITAIGGIMKMQKSVYTPEQIKRLSEAHRILCADRLIDPHSLQGREVAGLLLDKCTGDEPNDVILRRVAH